MNKKTLAQTFRKLTFPQLILIGLAVVLFALSPIGVGIYANAQDLFSLSSEAETPPSWLGNADSPEMLATDRSYAILAGKLINLGLVDTSMCPDKGMLANGNATACGAIAAHSAVILWQNQYDQQILLTAGQENVPPYLLKNILAIESQFWPSRHLTIYGYYEYGLGHITQMGADTLLHWNEPVYIQFCRSVFTSKTCEKPYTWLKAEEKDALRGAVLRTVSGDCEHCPGGVNLTQAKASIPVVAAAIKANYNNILWMLEEHTGRDPKSYFETSDLWRLASANYNAGPGCIESALKKTIQFNLKPTWKTISSQFDEGCIGAIQYVDALSNIDGVDRVSLDEARSDTNKASIMVLGNEYLSPTPKPTIEEPTATSEFTETPLAEVDETATPEFTATALPEDLATIDPAFTATETAAAVTDPTEVVEPSTTPIPTVENPTEMPTPFVPAPTSIPYDGETEGIIVKFRSYVPELISDVVLDLSNGQVTNQIDALGLTVMEVPASESAAVLRSLNSNLFVEYAEPDFSGEMMGTPPNDRYYADGLQPNLAALHIDVTAWDLSTGNNVVVAIIDTGVDIVHSQFFEKIWVNPAETTNGIDDDENGYVDDVNGWNFLDPLDGQNLTDGNGHGTHSAGIMVATHNDSAIAGIAPGAKLMVLKALDSNGNGNYSDIAEAITYAADNGADVIQIGFGGTVNSDALQTATDYAYSKNVTIVAAAGNSGTDMNYYPAANNHVIGVGALDHDYTHLADFSTFGSAVDLVAPGRGILSSLPSENYGGWSGSSVSSAQVTGIVALLSDPLLSLDTTDKIQAALFGTALSLGSDNSFGSGIPRAYEALAAGATMSTPTPGPTQTVTPMPNPPDGVTMANYEEFWAYTQSCYDLFIDMSVPILNPEYSSIGSPFPDATESIDNLFSSCDTTLFKNVGGYWQIIDFAKATGSTATSMKFIQKAVLSTQFYVSSSWVDDELKLQVSTDNGTTWSTLKTYNLGTPPSEGSPGGQYIDDISDLVKTPAQLNNFRFRLFASDVPNSYDGFTIYLDTVKLEVTGNLEPAAVIMDPMVPFSAARTDSVNFVGLGTDPEEGDLSANIVWMSNIDGKLGTGASLTVTGLTPGTHTITATITDSLGQTGSSKPITITITGESGPHGNFDSGTSACALCHRTHSAQAPGELLAYPSSSWDNNGFCLSCHSSGGGAEVVKTHSNKSYPNKIEGEFELLCVQCHDPHGNTGNLFLVRTNLYDGMMPTNLESMTLLATPVTFTDLLGSGSLGNTNDGTSVCVACHIGKTTNHTGGLGHTGPNNYSGQSCINCHSHSAFIVVGGEPIPNGFMANTPTPAP